MTGAWRNATPSACACVLESRWRLRSEPSAVGNVGFWFSTCPPSSGGMHCVLVDTVSTELWIGGQECPTRTSYRIITWAMSHGTSTYLGLNNTRGTSMHFVFLLRRLSIDARYEMRDDVVIAEKVMGHARQYLQLWSWTKSNNIYIKILLGIGRQEISDGLDMDMVFKI